MLVEISNILLQHPPWGSRFNEGHEAAIAEAEAANILGRGCLGTQCNVHVLVFRGAGAYICGEETVLTIYSLILYFIALI